MAAFPTDVMDLTHDSYIEFKNRTQPKELIIPSYTHGFALLHAWYFEQPKGKSRGLLVYFHGNGLNVSNAAPELYPVAQETGLDYLVFDYRGYGHSVSTEKTTFDGATQDGAAALLKAKELAGDKPLIVYAASVGGGTALTALESLKARGIQIQPQFIVLDSTFLSFESVVLSFGSTPAPLLCSIHDQEKMQLFAKKTSIPALIVTYDNDPIISSFLSSETAVHWAGKTHFVTFPGEEHTLIHDEGNTEYRKFLRHEILNALR